MMVGGIHDIVVGDRPAESAVFVVDSIMRMMGVVFAEARRIAAAPLPAYPPPDIDWDFVLDVKK
jgi:hypothetical protein